MKKLPQVTHTHKRALYFRWILFRCSAKETYECTYSLKRETHTRPTKRASKRKEGCRPLSCCTAKETYECTNSLKRDTQKRLTKRANQRNTLFFSIQNSGRALFASFCKKGKRPTSLVSFVGPLCSSFLCVSFEREGVFIGLFCTTATKNSAELESTSGTSSLSLFLQQESDAGHTHIQKSSIFPGKKPYNFAKKLSVLAKEDYFPYQWRMCSLFSQKELYSRKRSSLFSPKGVLAGKRAFFPGNIGLFILAPYAPYQWKICRGPHTHTKELCISANNHCISVKEAYIPYPLVYGAWTFEARTCHFAFRVPWSKEPYISGENALSPPKSPWFRKRDVHPLLIGIWWLRLVGSLKVQVSFEK